MLLLHCYKKEVYNVVVKMIMHVFLIISYLSNYSLIRAGGIAASPEFDPKFILVTVCVQFLQVLWFPPISQKHGLVIVNWLYMWMSVKLCAWCPALDWCPI